MSLSLFVYILHFIHISLLDFASQLRCRCQGAALALELLRGRARCEHKTSFYFMTFPLFKGIFSGSSVSGSSAGLGSDRGCLGHWLGSGAGGSGDSELRSIVSAEEDLAVSQEQLEMTVKAEIGKCDKLMD